MTPYQIVLQVAGFVWIVCTLSVLIFLFLLAVVEWWEHLRDDRAFAAWDRRLQARNRQVAELERLWRQS